VSKKPNSVRKPSKLKETFALLVFLLVTLGLVGRPLAKGVLFYQNYWGGAVFIPEILFIALLLVVAAVVNLKRK
jgi:hypothetical protein